MKPDRFLIILLSRLTVEAITDFDEGKYDMMWIRSGAIVKKLEDFGLLEQLRSELWNCSHNGAGEDVAAQILCAVTLDKIQCELENLFTKTVDR